MSLLKLVYILIQVAFIGRPLTVGGKCVWFTLRIPQCPLYISIITWLLCFEPQFLKGAPTHYLWNTHKKTSGGEHLHPGIDTKNTCPPPPPPPLIHTQICNVHILQVFNLANFLFEKGIIHPQMDGTRAKIFQKGFFYKTKTDFIFVWSIPISVNTSV